ncbi:hypothetical protein C7M84_000413 [Penaeus vannamei]|uniref:Ionotropic glutamate receptor L-glutamate and glycine-binding domain-containing protein n=1 Tax=Penaeus vannamei TaxID=6689 RepID=A0A3R7SY80_PENVA|nr:hypothetical protein C7M84_000413 [Penaeus vannamei]
MRVGQPARVRVLTQWSEVKRNGFYSGRPHDPKRGSRPATDSGASASAWARWVLEAFGRLSREPASYVAVAGGSRGGDETNGASCGKQDKQTEDREEQEVLPAGISYEALRRGQHGTTPLLVAPLLSLADAASLGKLREAELRLRPWLLLCGPDFESLVSSIYFPLDNLVVLAVLGDAGRNTTLWEVYQPAPDLPQRLVHVVTYPDDPDHVASAGDSTPRGSCPSFSPDPWSRRRDLSGLTVRCSSVEEEPFIYHRRMPDGTVALSGTYGDLWNTITKELNFTGVCRVPPDGEWGAFRNGAWTGAVGQVVRGQADVAVAALDQTYDRAKVVGFPIGISLYSYVLVIKRPSSLDHMWTNYVREFTVDAWVVAVVSLLVSASCLTLVGCLSPYEESFSPGDAALMAVASFCNSGYVIDLRSTSGRLVFASLYAMTILLYAHYSSFLFSSLTYSKDETIQAVWQDLVRHRDLSASQSFGLVASGSHAFLLSRPQYLSKHQSCELKMLPTLYFSSQSSWPIAKNSSLLPVFRYHLRNLIHAGIYQRSVQYWRPRAYSCDSNLVFQPMGPQQVITAFMLLACMVGLALGLLAGERMCHVLLHGCAARQVGAARLRRRRVLACP